MTEKTISKINDNTYVSFAILIVLLGAVASGFLYFGGLNEKITTLSQLTITVSNLEKRISALEYKDSICHICKSQFN